MREYQTYLPIDLNNPVNRNHPLNVGLKVWWLVVPAIVGGNKWYDLMEKYPATLTSMGNVNNGWKNQLRRGGFGSLLFDGSAGYLSSSLKIRDIITANGSISWWVYSKNTAIDGVWVAFWGQLTTTTTPEFSAIRFTDGNIYIGWNAGGSDFRVIVATTINNWPQNQWGHYVLTWISGGLSILYYNGKQIGTKSGTVINTPTNTFDIGRQAIGAPRFWNGYQDDFRIWNRALSATEVLQIYQNSQKGYPNLLNRVLPMGLPKSQYYHFLQLSDSNFNLGLNIS